MADVQQKINLDVQQPVTGLEKLAGLTDNLENALRNLGSSQKDSFTKATSAVQDFNRELADGTKIYQKIQSSSKAFAEEQKRLKVLLDQLRKSQKQFIAEGRYDELQKNIAGVKARIKELDGELEDVGRTQKKVTTEGGSMFQKFGGMLAGAFAVGTIIEWGKQALAAVFQVTAEFQKFEAVLTTSLGSSSAAQQAMLMIQDFAAKTPFSVQELTDSYVKLASRGIRPTAKELTSLGDLAASTGKSFDQLIEATLDAMSGENERLKEFGVTAKRTGETTQFTFKGVTTEVKNTDEAIKNYLLSIGEMEGVTGSMAAISDTLEGKMSNLGDTIDQFWLTLGQQGEGSMGGFISFMTRAVELATELSSTTKQIATKQAAQGVTDFAAALTTSYKEIAAEATKSGKDATAALQAQTDALKENLKVQEQVAIANFKRVQGSSLFKKDVDAAATRIELIRGQMRTAEDVQQQILDEMAKKANAAEAERIAEAAKLAAIARKKADDDRKKAIAALYKELENLEKQAEAARLEMINKDSKAYLQEVLARDIQAIKDLERTITDLQRKAGKSTDLTEEQQEQLRALSLAASKKYYDVLYALELKENDRLLELQQDSDSKAMQQLVNKYDAQIRAAEEAGQKEVAIALRTAKGVETAKLSRSQQITNIGQDQELAIALAENSIPGNLSKVEAEKLLQDKLLEIKIEYAEKELALLAGSAEKQDIIRSVVLQNTIKQLKAAQAETEKFSIRGSIQKLFGLDDEQMSLVEDGFKTALSNLSEFLAASVQLREREVDGLTTAIDEKGQELAREIDLNKQGFASNVETKKQEYEALKQQRETAQKELQQSRRNQILLDSAMQASNLITASTEIFSSLSGIPFVGIPLAIATIATMFGTFFAAKAKAMQAAKAPSFEKGGGLHLSGASHREGGIELVDSKSGNKLAEYEGNEFLFAINKNSTAKHLKLLEAINKDDKVGISRYALNELLSGTGVIPHPELPKQVQAIQASAKASNNANGTLNLKEINGYLKQISQHTQPAPQISETETAITIRQGNNTRHIIKHV